MSPVCLILCALLSASCVWSQVVLIQTGSEMKKPGESVKLKCKGTGFTMSTTGMNWVRQAPGKGLEWLAHYYGPNDKYYNSAIQDRFTASKDNSNVYLQMDRLKAEETANYYCARGTVQQKRLSSAQQPAMQFTICPVTKYLDFSNALLIFCSSADKYKIISSVNNLIFGALCKGALIWVFWCKAATKGSMNKANKTRHIGQF